MQDCLLTNTNLSLRVSTCLAGLMLQSLISLVFAAVMWVQVPQWANDWSQCSVDAPDVDCHWYVVAPDNTFGDRVQLGPRTLVQRWKAFKMSPT